MAMAENERTGPWRLDLIEPSPVNAAMLKACLANPDGLIATTIPVGELRKFCEAFAAALGVPACPGQTFPPEDADAAAKKDAFDEMEGK
jgi:hypothetical protein